MYSLVTLFARVFKRLLPRSLIRPLLPLYHYALSVLAALAYSFPARKLTVIGVTGTKGKSTTADMLYTIFKEAGYPTALASTIRFVTPKSESPNLFKMTMQGRGFLQRLLKQALDEGATHTVVEITSEGVLNFRHLLLALDGLIVTNVQKEHIERHGSFEKYVAAKRAIVRELERSMKKRRVLVANADNEHAQQFLNDAVGVEKVPFAEKELTEVSLALPIPGTFNQLNALAALKLAMQFGVPRDTALRALATMPQVKGRTEPVDQGQPFAVVVDYAHTPDSLEALYGAYPGRKICVLGNTGGGRDVWKRPLMGAIAERYCDTVILTNEDPYDEDPEKILRDMTTDMKRSPTIILDRREAISKAFAKAQPGDTVLISGKGTDPYIMEAGGKQTPWSDVQVAKEELTKLGYS